MCQEELGAGVICQEEQGEGEIRRKKSLYVTFFIGASIRIGREIGCLPYAGFFKTFLKDSV